MDLVQLPLLAWRPRTAPRRRPERSPPSQPLGLRSACRAATASRSRASGREVDLGERLLDQAFCWSSESSVLRVTFSVASTVRSATSLRICSSERRVSASMSRRAAATSSSRLSLAGRRGLRRRAASAALRARATMSSACSRASLRRSRYSASSSSASSRCALGRLDVLPDRVGALLERLPDPREGDLAQHAHREPEQRSASRSSARAQARPGSCRFDGGERHRSPPSCASRVQRPRGRTRSGRR